MNPVLYFLRSSEQKIATDMLKYVYKLNELDKEVKDFSQLDKFHKFYGLTDKDLGLYALLENKIVGAVWIRLLEESKIPTLCLAVIPEFTKQGIGSFMMKQLLEEAGGIFTQIQVSILENDSVDVFFEKLNFKKVKDSQKFNVIYKENTIDMVVNVSNKVVKRPTDGYDPRRWMD